MGCTDLILKCVRTVRALASWWRPDSL